MKELALSILIAVSPPACVSNDRQVASDEQLEAAASETFEAGAIGKAINPVDPLIILITVPLSICDALLPLAFELATLNIYTQIGFVTLIGLISKHDILMVIFTNTMQVSEHLDCRAAIIHAAQVRLRPILMTAGITPLLFASGAGRQLGRAGADLRHAGGHRVHPVRVADHLQPPHPRPPRT